MIQQLYNAAETGDLTEVKGICGTADKTELETLLVTSVPGGDYGDTVLHVAARYGRVAVLTYLLDLLPNLNLDVDQYGCTPLHVSAQYGKTECAVLLVTRGANVNCSGDAGWTPLHFAARDGYLSTVTALVNSGAAVNTLDNRGRTCLHIAAYRGHTDIVRYLCENTDVDPDIRRKGGDTALDMAVKEKETSTAAYLRKHIKEKAAKAGKNNEMPGTSGTKL